MKIFLLIALLFPVFFSCEKKPADIPEPPVEGPYKPVQITCKLSNDIDTIRHLIPGTWDWLEEMTFQRGQPGPIYLTPKTEGYTLTMMIRNDTLRFLKNNRPDSVYLYKIVRLKEIAGYLPSDELPALLMKNLRTGDREYHVPVKICDDFLILQHQYVSSLAGQQIWKRR